jgi:benzoate transport
MAQTASLELREQAAVSSWLAVGICFFINMLDGFDILAMSFTAALIEREWGLMPTDVGFLLSAGLAGMVIGSLFLSPIADTLGRRAVLLLCLSIITVGMLLSAFADSRNELALCRFLTGLGIGGLLAGITTVAAEYAPPQHRKLAIGLVTSSYPIGATLGGFAAIPLIAAYGWPSVFVFGGLLSLVLIPVVYFALPESLAFLLSGKPRNALARANAVLRRLDRAQIAALPEVKALDPAEKKDLLDIFRPGLRTGTMLICAAFFMNMVTFYFLMGWIPRIIVGMGLPNNVGIAALSFINLFGVVGGSLAGYWTGRAGLGRVTAIFMVLMYGSILLFGLVPPDPTLIWIAASILGFFMIGTMVGLYAIVAHVFPTHVRNTGTGVAIGLGRLGAVAGPYLAGLLIAAGWQRPLYFAVLGIPTLIAAGLSLQAARRERDIESV